MKVIQAPLFFNRRNLNVRTNRLFLSQFKFVSYFVFAQVDLQTASLRYDL